MSDARPIVVFDGVCHLCNRWVDLILRHDRSGQIRLSSIQWPAGRLLVERNGYSVDDLPTLLLIENGACYTHTDAIFRVLAKLGGRWRLFTAARVIPAILRDPAYRWIARHRYRLFGRRAACRLPDPATRARFVERVEEI